MHMPHMEQEGKTDTFSREVSTHNLFGNTTYMLKASKKEWRQVNDEQYLCTCCGMQKINITYSVANIHTHILTI